MSECQMFSVLAFNWQLQRGDSLELLLVRNRIWILCQLYLDNCSSCSEAEMRQLQAVVVIAVTTAIKRRWRELVRFSLPPITSDTLVTGMVVVRQKPDFDFALRCSSTCWVTDSDFYSKARQENSNLFWKTYCSFLYQCNVCSLQT